MKKIRNAAVLAAIGALALTGCGMGGPGASDDSAAADGKVGGEITFQTWNLKAGFQEYFEGLIADFEKQNPGTTVKWIDQPADGYIDKLSAQAASNTLPDVINLGPGPELVTAGMLVDISKADPSAKDDFVPGAWDAMTWEPTGEVYGYPWYLSTGPSLFNTALFSQSGLDPNALPTNYDQLFAQATEMAKAAKGEYSLLGSPPGLEDLTKYGAEILNEDGTEFTFNNATSVEMVQHYKDLYSNGGMLQESLSQTYTGQDAQFQSGKIAYMPGSAYNVKQVEENAPSIYSSLKVGPVITNTNPISYAQAVAVSKQSKNQATAMAFAKFVTNKDNQMAFAKIVDIFPSTVGAMEDPYFTESDGSLAGDVRVQSAKQISTAVSGNIPQLTESAKFEVQNQIALAIEGKKSIEDALADAQQFANDRMKEFMPKG